MQYLSIALPLAAMVSGAFATPAAWSGSCANNACLAAVTGKAALGDSSLRASHCASYLATTVTPIVTVTETITGSGNDNWKRATVAYCPNEVPNYASACDDSAYTSACSCFGYTEIKTTTVAPTTTTKTIWVKPTGGSASSCSVSTVTATNTVVSGSTCPAAGTSTKVIVTGTTVTETKTGTLTVVTGSTCPAGSVSTSTKYIVTGTTVTETQSVPTGSVSATTVTVTVNTGTVTKTTITVAATATTVTVSGTCTTSTSTAPASSCIVDDALATTLVNNFVDLLEFTSYTGPNGPPGRGYHQNVSDATLAADGFTDISDSINFMANYPLGSITFASKQAFDIGQGQNQPEVTVQVLNIWHDCSSITWRWRIVSLPFPVNGINHMLINADGKIQKNYAEFDNGAWLQSFGRNCSIYPSSAIPAPVSPALKRAVLTI